ncbi:glycosyl hydrolase [Xylariaceae sp. FL0804]|nr:glycosyl hydrolase [Xylariaceae sp. FL0804]
MVASSYFGGLMARAVFLMSSHSDFADQATYTSRTIDAITTLQTWYDGSTGLWDSTGWWNSANCLTTLADFAILNPTESKSLSLPNVIQNTYEQAQKTTITASKKFTIGKLPISTYIRGPTESKRSTISKRGFANFLDDYYDDEGWWALAMIRSHDLGVQGLGDQRYLQAAVEIFEDMEGGNSSCGGIYWSKVEDYTNAIANELYLSVAASLANRVTDKKDQYLAIAQKQWNWFKNSGLINENNLINDGLTSACKNNGETTWTYNQGVILGGLVELYKASGDASLLDEASTIATAAIRTLTRNGILYEGCEPNCGSDGVQFKGVFMRNLHYLQLQVQNDVFKNFLLANADAIWSKDRNAPNNELGPTWPGPYVSGSAGTQSSALDALVAAIAVS